MAEAEVVSFGPLPEPPLVAVEGAGAETVDDPPPDTEDPPAEADAPAVALADVGLETGFEVGTEAESAAEVVDVVAGAGDDVDVEVERETPLVPEPDELVVVPAEMLPVVPVTPTVVVPVVGVVAVTEAEIPIGSSARAVDPKRARNTKPMTAATAGRIDYLPTVQSRRSFSARFSRERRLSNPPPAAIFVPWSQSRIKIARAGPPSEPSSLSGRHTRR